MPAPFILASASPRRVALLQSIGVTPDQIIAADIDETPLKAEVPRLYAQRVARQKAEKIAETHPHAFILAADTVVACGPHILHKAETEEQARQCLLRLSGRRHQAFTAFCLFAPNAKPIEKLVATLVQFKQITPAELNWYVETGEWEGKAGGYSIQGAAQALIKRMDGSFSAVVGLPLLEVKQALERAGMAKA